ncbi:tyrosine-type recombinase/integrase [Alphaproteobacteria bacterium]|nr:tyrosine-type recombinase/integrase [Alphaproteobacteria bacterium]
MRNKCVANHVMKRDNQFYYVRHIPSDLTHHYSVQRICFSLKTKSDSTAVRFSKSITQRLDDYWFGMRLKNMNVPAGDKIKLDGAINDDETPKISDALDLYPRLKGVGKDKVFFRTAKRNIRYVIKVLGNKSLKSYSSSDGGKFRDWLLEEGMSVNTVKRVFSSIRSIINIAISEYGLDCSNGFARTYFPNDNIIHIRKPLPIDKIKLVHKLCKEYNDDLRWLVALLSDTGMRLGEGVGLLKSDINLDCEIPHINLIPHPWRRLKTKGSQRCIPLVGASLWACERILEYNNDSIYAFPRYTSVSICNANSASAALNKWMKEKLSESYVIHGFRHSMRDRLRAVECPSDIIDKIGGWITAGVGQPYGQGFPLEVISKWMNKI